MQTFCANFACAQKKNHSMVDVSVLFAQTFFCCRAQKKSHGGCPCSISFLCKVSFAVYRGKNCSRPEIKSHAKATLPNLLKWSGLKLNFFRVYLGCCHGINVTVLMEHPSILICGLQLSTTKIKVKIAKIYHQHAKDWKPPKVHKI